MGLIKAITEELLYFWGREVTILTKELVCSLPNSQSKPYIAQSSISRKQYFPKSTSDDYKGQWARITSRKTKPGTKDKGVLLDKLSTSFCCSTPASKILVLKVLTTVTFQLFVSKWKVFFYYNYHFAFLIWCVGYMRIDNWTFSSLVHLKMYHIPYPYLRGRITRHSDPSLFWVRFGEIIPLVHLIL